MLKLSKSSELAIKIQNVSVVVKENERKKAWSLNHQCSIRLKPEEYDGRHQLYLQQ
jgi:hypothetical protein